METKSSLNKWKKHLNSKYREVNANKLIEYLKENFIYNPLKHGMNAKTL